MQHEPDRRMTLTHLQHLEAESIHIMREVVAEADHPVMLYSIGKDSSVMLHLAMKAFYPAKPPFPLLHIRHDLEVPRDVRVPGPDGPRARTRSHRSRQPGGAEAEHQPLRARLGRPHRSDEDPGPEAGPRRPRLRRRLRRRPPRRGEVPGQGADLLLPFRPASLGPQEPATRAVAALQLPPERAGEHPGLPPLQLDRARRVAVHPPGADPGRAPLLRQGTAGGGARRGPHHGGRRPHAPRGGRDAGHADGSLPHARLLPADRRHRVAGRHRAGHHPRDAAVQDLRATGGRVIDHDATASMEKKKQEGYF